MNSKLQNERTFTGLTFFSGDGLLVVCQKNFGGLLSSLLTHGWQLTGEAVVHFYWRTSCLATRRSQHHSLLDFKIRSSIYETFHISLHIHSSRAH